MIEFVEGNLFLSQVEAYVNPVNCVGIMGAGIALAFRSKFLRNNKSYWEACSNKKVKVGKMFITRVLACDFHRESLARPKYIINFPTKEHWSNPSKIEWIQEGLVSLKQTIVELEIMSIAIPALGCGCGGLDWENVRPLIEQELKDLKDVNILVFNPK